MSEIIKNRYDFSILFDVTDGNPNGDPDRDNMPRMDDYNRHGLITPECIKRKIRDALQLIMEDEGKEGYSIYVSPNISLEQQNISAYQEKNINPQILTQKPQPADTSDRVVSALCSTFADIRFFGCVITELTKNKLPGGQLTGPVQLDMARSIDEIQPMRIGITRITRSTDKEILEDDKLTSRACRYIVPYGLYRCNGSISVSDARRTGFSEDDLALLWKCIAYMLENDRATGRGEMTMRELIVFKHNSKLGNARKQDLENLVKIIRKDSTSSLPARFYEDYRVEIDMDKLPKNVTCKRFVDPYAEIDSFRF